MHAFRGTFGAVVVALAAAGCGARTDLLDAAGEGAGASSAASSASLSSSSSSSGGGGSPAGLTCADAGLQAYICDENETLYTFDPATLVATPLGHVSCPADTIPWTMTVDGAGAAYLIYDDWGIYRVDLATLACERTPYVPGQLGFTGEEGIAVAAVNGVDRFFVYGSNPAPTLATSDLTSFVLSEVGPVTPAATFPVAIQGDAFGHLFALSQDSTFFELDSATADVTHLDHTRLPGGGNWAVMAYGELIYLFGAGGTVARYEPSTKRLTVLGSVGFNVIGASATPCVP